MRSLLTTGVVCDDVCLAFGTKLAVKSQDIVRAIQHKAIINLGLMLNKMLPVSLM